MVLWLVCPVTGLVSPVLRLVFDDTVACLSVAAICFLQYCVVACLSCTGACLTSSLFDAVACLSNTGTCLPSDVACLSETLASKHPNEEISASVNTRHVKSLHRRCINGKIAQRGLIRSGELILTSNFRHVLKG